MDFFRQTCFQVDAKPSALAALAGALTICHGLFDEADDKTLESEAAEMSASRESLEIAKAMVAANDDLGAELGVGYERRDEGADGGLGRMIFWDSDSARLEAIANGLARMQQLFGCDRPVEIEYADTATGWRHKAFGGGAFFIADGVVKHWDAMDFTHRERKRYERRKQLGKNIWKFLGRG